MQSPGVARRGLVRAITHTTQLALPRGPAYRVEMRVAAPGVLAYSAPVGVEAALPREGPSLQSHRQRVA